MNNNITINIPLKLKITILKKNNDKNNVLIIITNEYKKISFYTNKSNIVLDKWSNSITFEKKIITNSVKISNFFFEFLKSLDTYFFNKIKFKGKGFRIRSFKKIKLLKFFFGRSHKTYLLIKKIKFKKINKYKFLLYGLNKNIINNLSRYITKIKPINVYTLRGLRTYRQIIYKRKGKKGTYI